MGSTAAVSMVALGTGVSAYGKIRAGNEAKKIADRNAGIADWQATDALDRGKVEEGRQRKQTERVIGAQRAGFGMQGVDVNRGSALDVQADAAYLGELDALTIRNNAAKEAWGYTVQASNLRAQGRNAQREGTFGAFNTILGSSSSLLLAKYSGSGGLAQPRSTVGAPSSPTFYGPGN